MHRVRHACGKKRSAGRRAIERLECRRLLCLDPHPLGDELGELGTAPAVPGVESFPALPSAEAVDGGSGVVRAASKFPLSSIPRLDSLPDADAQLYLDFDGHFEEQWGSFRNVRTPAFDLDGDPQSFTQAELDRIRQIWQYVAEDYAPFRLNVTTVEPPSFADGIALRVVIGGDGLWSGGKYGGVAYVDSFTNYLPNTVYVFSKNLGSGNARYVADASSHESGHAFGLYHQSRYRGVTKIDEYYKGPGDGRAPLMGSSFAATRSLWWLGTSSVSYRHIQDDMEHIARRTNGFGYRPDDHGNSLPQATQLSISGSTATGAGIIERTTDVDYFAFETGAGRIHFTVSVAPNVNNLDATLKLLDSQGRVISSADPSDSFNATVTASITRAGKYYVVVGSHGSYGDVGQYKLSGTIVPLRQRGVSEPAAISGSLSSSTVQFGNSYAPVGIAGLLRGEAVGGSLAFEAGPLTSLAIAVAANPAASGPGQSLLVGAGSASVTSATGTTQSGLPSRTTADATLPLASTRQATLGALRATLVLGEPLAGAQPSDPTGRLPLWQGSGSKLLRRCERLSPQLVDRVFESWWS